MASARARPFSADVGHARDRFKLSEEVEELIWKRPFLQAAHDIDKSPAGRPLRRRRSVVAGDIPT
jgi:hypothetical protein